MNAIILQNEFGRKARIIKEVMAELLDVQHSFVFDRIDEASIRDAFRAMKIIGSSINKSKSTINEATSDLDELKIQDDITLPKSAISQMLFSINISKFGIGKMLELAQDTTQAIEKLLSSLKIQASYDYTTNCYLDFHHKVIMYRREMNKLKSTMIEKICQNFKKYEVVYNWHRSILKFD
uniref:Uncharacterized protein n=1 Tax=Caenorhabditis japonica TaxID=281687 RepID=A0A8R1E7Z0_CAEJA